MTYFLYTLFFFSCVLLIASVLLQPGKTDAGALFTSNISSTAFQPRGSQTILSKLTIAAATVFMLSALLLAMPALTGNISVLETNAETTTETVPPSPTDAGTNANVAVDANANVLPSNTAVVVNTNQLTETNTTSNTNAANSDK
ncbi:MAG: preprotein translocase subunit SecG [Pyrinomonadaceae bacterium]|nr:preprotein translocase subunit SecG [Pyrinomonadaceae bacterium]